MNTTETLIDIPFDKRHHCWFCGEPSEVKFTFPNGNRVVIDCPHPPLMVPCCTECCQIARQVTETSIWSVNYVVKRRLMRKYHKDLAIGLNWTQEELANSQFEGGNFEGFQRSAWFMYEVAQNRVNYLGWPISIDGIELEISTVKTCFTFDGVTYPNVDDAINHYTVNFDLNEAFFKHVLYQLGEHRFSEAVRFCRLQIGSTPSERMSALKHAFPEPDSETEY